jgi:hypothetical protein
MRPIAAISSTDTLSKPLALLTALAVVTTFAAYSMRAAAPAAGTITGDAEVPTTKLEKKTDDEPADSIRRFIDEAHFIPAYDAVGLEAWLKGIDDESGVDIRFVFTGIVGGGIDAYTVQRARELGVGRDVDKRGLLFVYDVVGQRMRVEVGPGLEGVFTDAFVGYLMREQSSMYFEGGHRMLALKATLWVVEERLRESAFSDPSDKRPLGYVPDSMRLAQGAGATARVTVPQESGPYRPHWPAAEVHAHFAPQPTVEGTYALYQEALRIGQLSVDLPMYAPAPHSGTKKVPLRFLTTPAFGRFTFSSEEGQEHIVVERGDLAIMIFTKTPLVAPHLFRRTSAGWHIDVVAEHHDTYERVGGKYTWSMRLTGDDYSVAFADLYKEYDGLLRPSLGDNRPLPKPRKSMATTQ